MSEEMKDSVDKLLETHEGRKHLEELQKRHELDILQPTNPDGTPNEKFQKVYGNQIKEREELRRREEDSARAEWERSEWRNERERRGRRHEGRKYL